MNLTQWAIRWGVPQQALADLRGRMVGAIDRPLSKPGQSEAAVQNEIRLEGAKIGCPLYRNNVGVLQDKRGVPVRYGLANDSKALNERVKSSDLIGCKPVIITVDMVGTTIGQFVAREVKEGNWSYSGTPRERAQLKFLDIILALGGDAAFANTTGTLKP